MPKKNNDSFEHLFFDAFKEIADSLSEPSFENAVESAEALIFLFETYLRHASQHADARLLEFAVIHAQRFIGIADRISEQCPEIAERIARQRINWPVLLERHPHQVKETSERLEDLGLGEASPMDIPKRGRRPWDRKGTLPNRLVLGALDYVFGVREDIIHPQNDLDRRILGLEDVTSENVSQWFGVIWDLICEEFLGRPETEPKLRALGVHRIGGPAQDQGPMSGSANSDDMKIRNGIKDALRHSFTRIFKS